MSKDLCTGWIPPDQRTSEQKEIDERIKDELLQPFGAAGPAAKSIGEGDEFCLYKAFGGQVPGYAWQTTGSCVGAGGYNALITLQHVEIVLQGESEETGKLFWPFTYGVSRRLGGMRRKGEGSFGSTWFKAIKEYGMPPLDSPGLPQYEDRQGWIMLDSDTEIDWSYDLELEDQYDEHAAKHPIKGGSRITSIEELDAALTNGYPCTIASMYGTRSIREKDGLMVAKWDDEWAHQMWYDAVVKKNGTKYYHWGNNWGPDAHPSPVFEGVPQGGFWSPERDVARNLRRGDTECCALSMFEGFPSQGDDFWTKMIDFYLQLMGA